MKAQRILRKPYGFTLVELMLVVAIIALLATIAIPSYQRARKRTQAGVILDDLRALDHAMDIYITEANADSSKAVQPADVAMLKVYVKERTRLHASLPNDLYNNPFKFTTFSAPPKVNKDTYEDLLEVTGETFWHPYNP